MGLPTSPTQLHRLFPLYSSLLGSTSNGISSIFPLIYKNKMSSHKSYSKQLLLVLLMLLGIQAQFCQQAGTDLLQSGSTVLNNGLLGVYKRDHTYQFTIGYTVPGGFAQMAVSASSFQVGLMRGLDFTIRGVYNGGNSASIVLLLAEENTWNFVRATYLLSSRSDLLLGTFTSNVYQLQRTTAGIVNAVYDVPNSQNIGSASVIVRFSGVKTISTTLNLGINAASFQSGQISVSLTAISAAAIELVYFSYIIVRLGGYVSFSSFPVSSGSSAPYQFTGIDQLNTNGANMQGTVFIVSASAAATMACAGQGCPSICITSNICLSLGGQILNSQSCVICGTGQTFVNGNCQASSNPSTPGIGSGTGQTPTTPSTPTVTTTCGTGQYFDGAKCVCNNGYVLVGSFCYQPCGTNAYLSNMICLCVPGTTYSAGRCVYATPSTPGIGAGTNPSTSSCGTNYVNVNGLCTCPLPFGLIGSLCVACPTGSYVSNGACICSNNSPLSTASQSCFNGNCPANSNRNSMGSCSCNDGYYSQNGQCIAQGGCQNGLSWNGNACVCGVGKYYDSFSRGCTSCNTVDRAISGANCVCAPSYFPTSVNCSPCPANSAYNPGSAQCVCNYGFQMQNGQCTGISNTNCPANSNWNSNALRCDCLTAQYMVRNGYCQPCPAFTVWNGGTCVCQEGFTQDISGSCIRGCPVNSYVSGGDCICNDGYNKLLLAGSIVPICAPCDPNSVYVALKLSCTCRQGYYGSYNNCNPCHVSCFTCGGPTSNQCTSCASGQVLSNGACSGSSNGGGGNTDNGNNNNSGGSSIDGGDSSKGDTNPAEGTNGCPTGYYNAPPCASCLQGCATCYDLNSCLKCLVDLKWNPTTKSCNGAPEIGSGTGAGSYLIKGGKAIGNGAVYQGIGTTVLPSAILANNCAACDTILNVTITSAAMTINTAVAYVKSTYYNFLITFTFPTIDYVPAFQFTVRINTTYAGNFTSSAMAQVLTIVISPTNFLQSTVSNPTLQTTVVPSLGGSSPVPVSRASGTVAKPGLAAATSVALRSPTILAQVFNFNKK